MRYSKLKFFVVTRWPKVDTPVANSWPVVRRFWKLFCLYFHSKFLSSSSPRCCWTNVTLSEERCWKFSTQNCSSRKRWSWTKSRCRRCLILWFNWQLELENRIRSTNSWLSCASGPLVEPWDPLRRDRSTRYSFEVHEILSLIKVSDMYTLVDS